MINKTNKYNVLNTMQVLFGACAIYLCFLPVKFSANNFIYAIGQIHAYDNTLFTSNVYMSDNGISPRYVFDALFALVMKINGGSWIDVAVPSVYISTLILAVATAVLAFRISKTNRIFYAVVLALFFAQNTGGKLAGFNTFSQSTIGTGMGYSFAVLAIAFTIGEKKSFNKAWLVLTVATVFHVHEGLYGFAAVFLLFLVDIIYHRNFSSKDNWCIIVYFIVLFAVIIPNILTDQLNISNEEFIYIYAMYRHPHHLIPSAWGNSSIIKSFLLILFPVCYRLEYLFFHEKRKIPGFALETLLFMTAWVGALAFMYVGTEKLKIAAVATMYVSKFFKYVSVISLIWYVITIKDYFIHHEFMPGFLILFFAGLACLLESYALIIFVCISAFIFHYMKTAKEKRKGICLSGYLTVYAFVAFEIFAPMFHTSLKLKIILFILTLIISVWYMYLKTSQKIYKLVSGISLVVLLLSCTYGNFYQYTDGKLTIISPSQVLVNTSGQDIFQLSCYFKEKTDITEGFMSDPHDENRMGWMQIISQRNCYVISKVVPSSKAMVKEWYERLQRTSELFKKDTAEIAAIMKTAQINYLLVPSNYYEKIEESKQFEVFVTCDGDSYRIYRISS